MMPFVTEEIWSYHPAREGHLAVHPFPRGGRGLIDAEAEAEVGEAIELTRRLRAWRELAGVPVGSVLSGRFDGGQPPEFVGRLARFEFSGRRRRSGRLDRPGSGAGDRRDRRRRGAGADRGTARGAEGGGRAGGAQARQPGIRREGAARGGRGGARKLAATAPSSRSSSNRTGSLRRRGLPRLARAARLAVRPRADAPADLGARHAPAPLRLDPRRRHQRQVLGRADDRGAARGARGEHRRLPLAAPAALVGAGADPRRGDRARAFADAVERTAQAAEVVNRALDEEATR